MVVPVAAADGQVLQVLHKRGDALERQFLTACRFVPLIEEADNR